jgi:hypothetical protein
MDPPDCPKGLGIIFWPATNTYSERGPTFFARQKSFRLLFLCFLLMIPNNDRPNWDPTKLHTVLSAFWFRRRFSVNRLSC